MCDGISIVGIVVKVGDEVEDEFGFANTMEA